MNHPLVIVGTGVAGHHAIRGARSVDSDIEIVAIGDEDVPPYDRPAVSKGVLAGTRSLDEVALAPRSWYREHRVELRLAAAVDRIEPDQHRLTLAGGGSVTYEALVVATGSEPVRLPHPGMARPGVVTIRDLADADAARRRLADGARVVVIGAGLVGTEFAASARSAGCEVSLLDQRAHPLEVALGPRLGQAIAALHERNGVDVRMGVDVAAVLGAGSEGPAESVSLADGHTIPCDLVVVAVGARPRTRLLTEAGARAGNGGIVVDDRCQTTLDRVYAAGDIATWRHPLSDTPLRLEHYDNAVAQGFAAGASAVGGVPPPPLLPSFWTDQYDTTVLWTGLPGEYDEVVVRGDIEPLDASVFYLSEGHVRAVAAVNRPRDLRRARGLIEARSQVDPRLLADADKPLP